MVKIRLTRGGAKKRPFYHLVATDQRSARDGRYIERLGYYNPIASGAEKPMRLNMERIEYWVGVGAQMSDRVKSLVKQAKKDPSLTESHFRTELAEARAAAKEAAAAAANATAA